MWHLLNLVYLHEVCLFFIHYGIECNSMGNSLRFSQITTSIVSHQAYPSAF